MTRRTDVARWRLDFPCDRAVLAVREFLTRVAVEIGGMEPGTVPNESPWDTIIPTTIRLVPVLDDPLVSVTSDVDFVPDPRFVTGIKAVERIRYYPAARMQQVAVRSCLVQPALVPEREARSAHLDAIGYPLRVCAATNDLVALAYHRLTHRERNRLPYIPIDERVALAAVLVAAKRPVAAFSSDALWPRHSLVRDVSARLECRIVRRPLEEIPERVRRQLRFLRYHPVEPIE